ncbi:MAG: four helix bundle protein [bacterium]|nr:four helix bundle protein [bacterium]
MSKLNPSHTSKRTPPLEFSQPKLIPVILKLKDAYGIWQNHLTHFPKASRYTLGSKIDDMFLSSIEYCFLASYSQIAEKTILLNRCISRVDLLKLLVTLAWDTKAIDTNKYAVISESLFEIGRMLGGWKRQLANKTPER